MKFSAYVVMTNDFALNHGKRLQIYFCFRKVAGKKKKKKKKKKKTNKQQLFFK